METRFNIHPGENLTTVEGVYDLLGVLHGPDWVWALLINLDKVHAESSFLPRLVIH